MMHKHIPLGLFALMAVSGWQRCDIVTPEESHATAAPEAADNAYCYVCHINCKSEDIAVAHEKTGAGCETCHGLSAEHSADENGLTAPDRMFAAL